MKVGDLVKIPCEWVELNPWMQTLFREWGEAGVGIIVKDFGHDNHHVVVLAGGREHKMSKTRLELVCK